MAESKESAAILKDAHKKLGVMTEELAKPEKGDAVMLEYSIIDKASSRVVDTTSEEIAKEHGIYSEDARYGPRLIILGAGELPQGFEDAVLEMREGEEREFELPAEKAFGKRDPSKVRVVPAREFSARGVIPRAGMEVDVRGEKGTIISVGGGRVIVDFNHPLAGRDLLFKVKLVKVYKRGEEKVKAIFGRYITINEASLNFENGIVTIMFPFQALFSTENLAALEAFARDVDRYISEVKSVRLVATLFERKSAIVGAEKTGEASTP